MKILYIFGTYEAMRSFIAKQVIINYNTPIQQSFNKEIIFTSNGEMVCIVINHQCDLLNAVRGLQFDIAIYDTSIDFSMRMDSCEFIRSRIK